MQNRPVSLPLMPNDILFTILMNLWPEQIALVALVNKNLYKKLFSRELDLVNKLDRELDEATELDKLWESKRIKHFPHRFDDSTTSYIQFKNIYKKVYAPVMPAFLRPVFSIVIEGRFEPLKQFKFSKETTWTDIKDDDGNSLIHYAHINARVTKDNRILDPLYDLVQTNFLAKAATNDFFIDTTKIDTQKPWDQTTILLWAITCHRPLSYIKELFEKGSNYNEVYYNGHRPIHLAADSGLDEIVDYLINCDRQELNQTNELNETPLFYACAHGHYNVVKFFLDQPETNLTIATNNIKSKRHGWTALHYAANAGHNEIVDLILIHSYSKISISIATEKAKLDTVIQGKLELIEYISKNKLELIEYISKNVYTCTTFGPGAHLKIVSAAKLQEIVFFNGNRDDYQKLLHQFKKKYGDNLGSCKLGRIYKKLEKFLEAKVTSLPYVENTMQTSRKNGRC